MWAPFNPAMSSASYPHWQCPSRIQLDLARAQGAVMIFGGIHATLYPDEALSLGGAQAVVKGDGDVIWPLGTRRCDAGSRAMFMRVTVRCATGCAHRRGGWSGARPSEYT